MKIDQLRVFQKIVELGSIRATGEALNRTQPAISQSMKHLESSLGVELLDRSAYRVSPTIHGRRIFNLTNDILERVGNLETLAHHISTGQAETLRIAYEPLVDMRPIFHTLRPLQERFPDSRVALIEENLTGPAKRLFCGEADIAISPSLNGRVSDADLDRLLIARTQMISVISAELLGSAGDQGNIPNAREFCQIVLEDTGVLTGDIEIGVGAGQRKWYVDSLTSKLYLVEQGVGWGKLPRHLVQQGLDNKTLVPFAAMESQIYTDVEIFAYRKMSKVSIQASDYLWSELAKQCLSKS